MYGDLPAGHPLADAAIHTSLKNQLNFARYRGKVMVIVLISINCPHCTEMLPAFSKLQDDFGPRGVQVIGAAGDSTAAEKLPSFLAQYHPNYPFGFVSQQEFIKIADLKPGVRPFVPVVMFVDRRGMVRLQFFGNDGVMRTAKEAAGVIQATVEELLHESPALAAPKKAAAPKPAATKDGSDSKE